MTRRAGLALALLLLAGFWAPARSESLWELALPGEPLMTLDAHSIALGGAADARWDLESGLPANPAQLRGLEGFTFATVIQLRRARRDIAGDLWDETRQDFPALQISASLPGRLSLGIGYRASLRSRGSFVIPYLPVPGDTTHYDMRFAQEGGVNAFPIDLGMSLGSRLRLGAGLSLYRGRLEQEWLYDFPNDPYADQDLEYQDRKIRRQAEWRGQALRLGLQSMPRKWLAASASWESAADLEGESRSETGGESEPDSLLSLSGRMPSRWSAGLAFSLQRGIHLSAQWDHEDWSAYESPVSLVALHDVDRYSFGFEWIRQPQRQELRRDRRFPLRLGFRLGNLPRPDPLAGGRVSERLLSLGTGLDIQEGRGSIDLALYWQRLNVDDSEGETRWGLALGLRTSEIWKKRTLPY